MTEYWVTRWYHKEYGKWYTNGAEYRFTEAEAREQLKQDVAYFWNNVPIQLIKVTEEVIEATYGSNNREP